MFALLPPGFPPVGEPSSIPALELVTFKPVAPVYVSSPAASEKSLAADICVLFVAYKAIEPEVPAFAVIEACSVIPEAERVSVVVVLSAKTLASLVSTDHVLAATGSTKNNPDCPGSRMQDGSWKAPLAEQFPPPPFDRICQVVGVMVTLAEVPFTSLNEQFGTPRVVGVGKVTATADEPVYMTRVGLQSVERIVSVVPVTDRPTIPGKAHAAAVATPADGVLVRTSGTPFGEVAPITRDGVPEAPPPIKSPSVVMGLTKLPNVPAVIHGFGEPPVVY